MIKKSEDFSFLIGAIITTLVMASLFFAKDIKKFETLSERASKTESIHYVTIVDVTKKVETKKYKKPIKKPQKRIKKEVVKVVKKLIKKPKLIDEAAQIKEKIVQKQKLFEKELEEQLLQEELARQKEFRKRQLAKKNLLEKEKDIYLSELAAWIKQHLKYPRHARRMNQQGVVKISFIITKHGHIESVKIDSPCPYKRLNKAAKMLLVELNRFKPLPENLDKWELNVPIIYALKD
ncbi:energy transducer TonB [Sulfurimonas sp.]|uniref:energy transducer TonB n=1 Tax=Sulfurimonas sp. TaxID=2022749 RepID=UPI002B493765|nr:energy transducer TonB [Sulfurimonas sp.]